MNTKWTVEDMRAGTCEVADIGHPRPIPPEPATPSVPYKGVKDSFEKAFQAIGGIDALVEWAKEHKSAFFNMMPKLLPPELKVDLEATFVIQHALPPPRNLSNHAPITHWDVNSLVTILRQIPAEDREQIRLALNPEPVALPNNLGGSNESDP